MKILTFVAAALVALTGTAATAAPAPAAGQERVVVRERTVHPGARNTRVVVRERTTVRRNYGWRNRNQCDWRWRGGHRVRVCRSVRYR